MYAFLPGTAVGINGGMFVCKHVYVMDRTPKNCKRK